MKNTALVRILTGLILGLIIGLLYGWVLRPVEYINTTPSSLRADYRTDYILMVAEAYTGDQDLDLALVRLAALGPQPPLNIVLEAIDYGIENEFSRSDLDTLNRLATQLRTLLPSPEIGGP
ncbi:MAG: hypothetical protein GTO14_02210 [Anaerolineales bacterium]|nr:hypothetical protein [Anaerolineales bacterium]